MRLRRWWTLDAAVPALLAATVFVFAAGTSAVNSVRDVAQTLRWAMLLALLAAAAPWGLRWAQSVRGRVSGVLLVGFALLSTAWSVDPPLTLGRGVAFGVLLTTVGLLGAGLVSRPDGRRRVGFALLAGALAVMVASLALLAVDPDGAVQDATSATRARLHGLAENPNGLAMVAALGLPLAVALLTAATTHRARAVLAGGALVLFGGLVAANSRAGYLAAGAGLVSVLLLVPGERRARLVLAGVVAATFVLGMGLGQLGAKGPQFAERVPTSDPANPLAPYPDLVCVGLPPDDVGQPPCGETGVATGSAALSSGRTDVWRGALGQVAERPLVGYGFGTENQVFIDRYTFFQGDYVENSYLGMLLQLGVVGLGLLLTTVAAALLGVRDLRQLAPAERAAAAGLVGVAVAGVVMANYQSYLTSVGSIGALTVWAALGSTAAIAARQEAA